MATIEGHGPIIRLLLDHPDIYVYSKMSGYSALDIANQLGHTEIAGLLEDAIIEDIQRKIDVYCKMSGCSALDIANKLGHTEIAGLLEDANIDDIIDVIFEDSL